jgi:1A family penicillin-binding protein
MPNYKLQKKNTGHKYQKSWKDNQQKGSSSSQGPSVQRKKSLRHRQDRQDKKLNIKGLLFNKKTALLVLGAILILGVVATSTIAWMSKDLPNPDQLISREVAQTTKIYDRSGETLLYKIHGEEQRTLMTLEEIPDHVEQAAIAIEDKNFYNHEGFSIWAIFRTAVTNVLRNKRAGASTLTQQLVKNTVLSPEKTYTRKIKELILAYRMEKVYSKNDILQMYLNEIPYGGMAYGVEAACQHYFGKSVQEANIAEAAVLAAIPQAPSYYSPYGPHKELLIQRQKYILGLMRNQGYITEEEAEEAKSYKLTFKNPSTDIKAPHFVMYVKRILAEKYGQRMLEQGGLKIYTTLDWYKQEKAEKIVQEAALKNTNSYNARNAALVSIDPKTGQVLAMVGSRDYFDKEIDGQFNVATSKRQPGSSLKPMAYATAFGKGFQPGTILMDTLTDFDKTQAEYKPRNFDNNTRGPISMRKALAGSLNIPAVKTLYLAGVDKMIDNLNDLGYSTFTKENRDRFGLSLVLGGGEVKLLEHTNAYGAFAREGELHPVATILKVEDNKGKVLEEFENKTRETWQPQVARMINDVLSDNNARAFAYGQNNWLTLANRPVAAKTGTTNDFKDAWTIGYTPSLVTGVWVGNNNNDSMARGAYGGTVAAPIWNEYMKTILGDTPVEEFKKPDLKKTGKPVIDGDIEFEKTVKIDTASGLLATEYTPENYIKEVTFKDYHSILHYVDKNDPLGDDPADPEEDPQYRPWEEGVQRWMEENKEETATSSSIEEIPEKEDNLHKPENRPQFTIETPTEKQVIDTSVLQVQLKEASAPRGIASAKYFIDGNLLAINNSFPFGLKRDVSFLRNGYHDLEVVLCDDIDNCSSQVITFNLKLDEQVFSERPEIIWLAPNNGLAVNSIDFPLDLRLQLKNYPEIDRVEIFYTSDENEDANIIQNIDSIESPLINTVWPDPPSSGVFTLRGRIYWEGGNMAESSPLVITVTTPE